MSKVIPINPNLEKINQQNRYNYDKDFDPNQFYYRAISKTVDYSPDNEKRFNLQYSKVNETNVKMNYGESFLQAWMNAYNNHEDIVLSPDDIWLVICLNFSKYVNDNSNELRKIFVDHDGKIKLTVTEPIGKDENDWTDFFGQMKEQIRQNVKGEIVQTLESNFSTTGLVEGIISYACIMDTFKEFFEYGRCIPCCGIRNVVMMGVLEDWIKLKEKTVKLGEFGGIKNYVENLVPILDEFINTFNENPNVDYWNKVMNIERGRLGSGSTTKISGWFLNFYNGLSGKVDVGDVSLNSIKVEVKVVNYCTGQSKTCFVMGGFVSVKSENGSHRPVMSLGVVEDRNTVQKM